MTGNVNEHRATVASTVTQVLAHLDDRLRSGAGVDVRTVPTGFSVLDEILGGGLHAGELVLLGGPPGVGKTIAALQWARTAARAGQTAIFVCYEHSPTTLLVRLLGLETGELGGKDEPFTSDLAALLAQGDAAGRSLEAVLADHAAGADVLARVREYADRLMFVQASGAHTTLASVADLVEEHRRADSATVVFVDYLQKVPLQPEPPTEAEKVTRTVEALKDLALELGVAVVLLSAVDAEGMRSSRLRMYHLRGSSAIAFESDVVLMMNAKEKTVSKVHLSYDPIGARSFRDWVVVSIEKNRGGPNLIDLEFKKDFRHFRLHPAGGVVSESLVDERSDEALI